MVIINHIETGISHGEDEMGQHYVKEVLKRTEDYFIAIDEDGRYRIGLSSGDSCFITPHFDERLIAAAKIEDDEEFNEVADELFDDCFVAFHSGNSAH